MNGQKFFYYGNNAYFPLYLEGAGLLTPGRMEQIGGLAGKIGQRLGIARRAASPGYYTGEQEKAFIRSLKKEGIQVVLAEYGQTGAHCTAVCRELNLPLIVHFHGLDASIHSVLEKYGTLYKQMFAYASHTVVVSGAMREKILQLGAPADKVVLNTYGPDDAFFSVKPRGDSREFLAVGRFVDKKAPYLTIMAFLEAARPYPGAKLKMIGDGPLMNTCINLVKSLDAEDKVLFPGVRKPAEIRSAMQHSLAFVQHSVTALDGDTEGTPVGILEASAAGLPVIATRHAGIPEVIRHQETGILVEELDVKGMAGAMKAVLEDPDRAAKMGRAGKQFIREHFSMEKHISHLNQIIRSAVQSAPGIRS